MAVRKIINKLVAIWTDEENAMTDERMDEDSNEDISIDTNSRRVLVSGIPNGYDEKVRKLMQSKKRGGKIKTFVYNSHDQSAIVSFEDMRGMLFLS